MWTSHHHTLIRIYIYTLSIQKNVTKERFWVLPSVSQRVSLEMCGILGSVYTYIQSARKDRIRSVLCVFTQVYRVAGYMDHNTHGSIVYIYRIRTYGVLWHLYRCRKIKTNLLEGPVYPSTANGRCCISQPR